MNYELEKEVIAELLKGKPTKEIAATLFRAEKTIKWRLTQIFKKYGVRTRGELIIKITSTGRIGTG